MPNFKIFKMITSYGSIDLIHTVYEGCQIAISLGHLRTVAHSNPIFMQSIILDNTIVCHKFQNFILSQSQVTDCFTLILYSHHNTVELNTSSRIKISQEIILK